MKCLCCGRNLTKQIEMDVGWHTSCIKRFFGTTALPGIVITMESIEQLARRSVNKKLTVPGVQKKISLHLSSDKDAKLTLVNYPTGYILKPPSDEYVFLPELEHLSMHMARELGIQTVPFSLIHLSGGECAYITKRIDRISKKGDSVKMLAMEDFCQLSGRMTSDKYRGSYERCAKIINRFSVQPGFDLSEFFLRLVFCFVIGNSDMHLTNFSLIEKEPGGREYYLSAAYDLLPVNLIIPEDLEETALSLNGKKNNITRNDFIVLAERCFLNKKAAENMINKTVSMRQSFFSICDEAQLPDPWKERFKQMIDDRIKRIR